MGALQLLLPPPQPCSVQRACQKEDGGRVHLLHPRRHSPLRVTHALLGGGCNACTSRGGGLLSGSMPLRGVPAVRVGQHAGQHALRDRRGMSACRTSAPTPSLLVLLPLVQGRGRETTAAPREDGLGWKCTVAASSGAGSNLSAPLSHTVVETVNIRLRRTSWRARAESQLNAPAKHLIFLVVLQVHELHLAEVGTQHGGQLYLCQASEGCRRSGSSSRWVDT